MCELLRDFDKQCLICYPVLNMMHYSDNSQSSEQKYKQWIIQSNPWEAQSQYYCHTLAGGCDYN